MSHAVHGLEVLIESADKNLTFRNCVGHSYDLRALVAAGQNKTNDFLHLCLKCRRLSSYSIWHSIDKNRASTRYAWKESDAVLVRALKRDIFLLTRTQSHNQ